MSTRVALNHHLRFVFHRPVDLTTLWLRLRPAPHTKADIEAYSIKVHAKSNWLNWVRDPFENHLGRLDLPEPVARVGFDVDIIANLAATNPFDFLVEPFANDFPFEYPDQLRKELSPYLHLEDGDPHFAHWLDQLDYSPCYLVEFLTRLNDQVHETLTANSPTEPKRIDLGAVVKQGGGSPWELAWALTQSLRFAGLAARFTSGYLISLDSGREGNDLASMHAWSEVFVPGAGWVGLDPSSGVLASEHHIPLASAPDPSRTVPLVGVLEQAVESRQNEVRVRRLKPTPPCKPLSETQWRDIAATGHYVDHVLKTEQIGLCSRGEVNFVSAVNDHLDEWTHSALGDDKRHTAQSLLNRLRTLWAPGGAIHLSQGEHFQGEPTARWKLMCTFRADGRPLWKNPALLATCQTSNRPARNGDAEKLAQALATELGLSTDFVIPAYEDTLYKSWTNAPHLASLPRSEELQDPQQRQQLADRLSAPLGDPTGFALPLSWDPLRQRWASGRWQLRRSRLYLLPGDFPVGFRLPLDSLSKQATERGDIEFEPSPFEEKPSLPELFGESNARQTVIGPPQGTLTDVDSEQNVRAPRTALCVQSRDDVVHVFFPPIHSVDHYVQLIAAIESAAEATGTPVVLEGYPPPHDHRLKRFSLEPDNGLLRLFLPAARTWQQEHEFYQTAYTQGGIVGLRSRHDEDQQRSNSNTTVTLSGPTPSTSPFLTRPQILRSLIAYWHNHPCLSYLFRGTGIGPSSDAPRPDEGRDDALYELGIALSRFPTGDTNAPWVPDRLLRHLLADASGNMKRAEIRVDQLYAPERQSRRLGQITLHSFGMAPTDRLAALQSLLVRGLVASFARQPYTKPIVPWQGEIHDRFMLPQVLSEDLESILDDLRETGIVLQSDWFAAIIDLNFPRLGRVKIGDITLELRRAHEPWPLLAEETSGGGVARFIDTANERLQVRVSNLPPDRYVLACNRASVPLCPSAIQGTFVAGVRYKVDQPIATLHPTVSAVDSLVFDLIDTWTGRAIGGCTYFPARPQTWTSGVTGAPLQPDHGGRKPVAPTPPMTLAATPVSGRFTDQSSGIGSIPMTDRKQDRRFPYLLDLTKAALDA
ncbi:MAG: IMP dehydrogenase [Pirellulaceae bacterium]|nr:IMP dehydrogenase [Pirellulaceae bacterium]